MSGCSYAGHVVDDAKISRRMRDLLIGDLALADPEDEGDYWTHKYLTPTEWTSHLARQLGIDDYDLSAGLHDTLLFLVLELDRDIYKLRPDDDLDTLCDELAELATRGLSAVEVYTSILAGPRRWQNKRIEAGRISALPNALRNALKQNLATELGRVLNGWLAQDLDELKRKLDAIQQGRPQSQQPPPSTPRRRQTPQERADRRRLAPFQPPGRR